MGKHTDGHTEGKQAPPEDVPKQIVQPTYRALASDYDSTLAFHGVAPREVWKALEELKEAGIAVILVTGRHLPEVQSLLGADAGTFSCIVAENGGLLFDPIHEATTLLVPPFPDDLAAELRRRHVVPLSVGQTMCASWEGWEKRILETSRDMGYDMAVERNRGSIMVQPRGTNKATGLRAALRTMRIEELQCVGVGDGENDVPFVHATGLAVAVENACQELKDAVDLVIGPKGAAGILWLVTQLLQDRLPIPSRHAHS